MKKLLIITILLLVILAGAWYALALKSDTPSDTTLSDNTAQTLTIATSFYPLEFALNELVGDLGVVTNIASGIDPHDFRPSTQDILTLQKSDLVVLHGAELEPWGDDVAAQLTQANVPVVFATKGLTLLAATGEHTEHGDEHGEKEHEEHHDEEHDDHVEDSHDEHAHGEFDPHTWLDPILFTQTIKELTNAVISLDPQNREAYEARSALLQANVLALDTQYSDVLSNCTLEEVITSHDAFGYIAHRYGFEIHSIAGLSTQDTPSTQTLAELKKEAQEGIGAILLEENSIVAYGETLSRETGLTTMSINPISFSVPDGEDYLTLMKSNLNVFKEALVCNE